MWDEWVSGLRFKEEENLLFCDSCHQGKADFLQRDEHTAAWMQENFVAQLRRADGTDVTCATCHGQPHQDELLDAWPPTE